MSTSPRATSFALLLALFFAAGPAPAQDAPLADEPAAEAATDPIAVKGGEEIGEDAPPETVAAEGEADVEGVEALTPEATGWQATVNEGAGAVAGAMATVMFYDLSSPFMEEPIGLAAVVVMLVLAAIFFTVYTGFINLRAFKHALEITAGKWDTPGDEGEVSHFQALAAALSATVGLGNIAGVAIAVSMGGPGAVFWMVIAGLLGMSSKFMECTLGQKYRKVRADGKIMGGAMYYLSDGLSGINLKPLGVVLAGLFAVLCVGGSMMGGNAFQVNQSLGAVGKQFPELLEYRWVYGLVMTFLVGLVILGGIQRIAATAGKIVPLMCGIYVAACLFILGKNFTEIPDAFGTIVGEAFKWDSAYGGFIGVLIMGFRRAAFSNEAGVGSAAIAHSAAKSEYPIQEGIVALLEPFIDTVVVCTMTALVIVITGAYADPELATYVENNNGAALTSAAMGSEISWFPYVLSGAAVLFAYSTMISWSYYGERSWCYLFGDAASIVYRIIFLIFVFLGSIISATNVLELGDLMILGMAIPNIIGVVLLSPVVKRDLNAYWSKYRSGELKREVAAEFEAAEKAAS
ncbi:alanine/glycine:cation symporter family protein [Alienimonas sp. DA493]|uniref:alanine/glycine:cation symporter family protein n=1 Tax=Alienimonas sp. DA493 TaxID=3373605 RepID=UPI0037547509